jgi:exopolyphosphatase/pppGpp-phosphohydrolase
MIHLHIGEQQTAVEVRAGRSEPAFTHTLPLGSRSTAAAHFQHDPPTPGEMENAITAVEDVVMPLHKLIAGEAALVTDDVAIRQIALLAGVPDAPQVTLSLEALERVFDRLASLVMGGSASSAALPPGPQFAATLLILREFMHHLKFASITIRSAEPPAQA